MFYYWIVQKLDICTITKYKLLSRWDHPLKTSANFHYFWPIPLSVGSFLLLSVGKFDKKFDPSPLKIANVLKGWSLCKYQRPLFISQKLQLPLCSISKIIPVSKALAKVTAICYCFRRSLHHLQVWKWRHLRRQLCHEILAKIKQIPISGQGAAMPAARCSTSSITRWRNYP